MPTLSEFRAGAYQLGVLASRVAAPQIQRTLRLAADDTDRLISHEGDVVTIIGRVSHIRRSRTHFGQPYVFLNFGDYRDGCFTIVLWSDALDLFYRAGVSVNDYREKWVSVTGLITVYRSRYVGRVPQPQVVVNMPSEIQILSPDDARAALGGPSDGSAARWYEHDGSQPAPRRQPGARNHSAARPAKR